MGNFHMTIALLKDQLANEILNSSYALLKLVRAGERQVNMEFLAESEKIINEIKKEIQSGKSKQIKSSRA